MMRSVSCADQEDERAATLRARQRPRARHRRPRAPPHAAFTMARSRRRLGAKMPGVSMKMICALSLMAMPRTGMRVVCTFCVTMETFCPTGALTSVDLPELGAPNTAMNPQRVGSRSFLP